MQYEVILHPVALIRPSEEVNMEHVIALTEEIARCQKWITPVPIEKTRGSLWMATIDIAWPIILG